LNVPYVIVIVNLFTWIGGTFFYEMIGLPNSLVIGISSGSITIVLAFFWVEHITQHHLVPIFFPKGDLSSVKGGRSVGLRVKLGALIVAVSIVPLTFIHLTIYRFREMQALGEITPEDLLTLMQETISIESVVFIVMGIFLSVLLAHNLRKPVEEIIRVLKQVKRGNFAARAKVYTTDELGFAGETLNAMTAGLKEREMIRSTFGRYVGDAIRDEILKGEIPMDGEIKQATIMFADLRNFTPLVEMTPPRELIHLLNDYLNEMTRCIRANNGMVLQFIGDEIEAVFGAPVPIRNPEQAALKAALDMRESLGRLNQIHMEQGYSTLSHGIGIHSGQVLAANVGTRQRTAYSMIGNTVNLASRIQELNKEFRTDILVSSRVFEKAKQEFHFDRMPEVRIRGKAEPITVYSLQNAVDADRRLE
ncbi:MAG: HAMP domain-containing protein, partial [Desulfobacterales bacterium]|nr:HAMP domain-containing protein [Desulfobacterales bacterium]